MCEKASEHVQTLKKLMRKTVAEKWNVLWKGEKIYEKHGNKKMWKEMKDKTARESKEKRRI